MELDYSVANAEKAAKFFLRNANAQVFTFKVQQVNRVGFKVFRWNKKIKYLRKTEELFEQNRVHPGNFVKVAFSRMPRKKKEKNLSTAAFH